MRILLIISVLLMIAGCSSENSSNNIYKENLYTIKNYKSSKCDYNISKYDIKFDIFDKKSSSRKDFKEYEDGMVCIEETFGDDIVYAPVKNGLINGIMVEDKDNDGIWIYTVKDGVANGKAYVYNKMGILLIEGTYENGLLVDEETVNNYIGTMVEQRFYKKPFNVREFSDNIIYVLGYDLTEEYLHKKIFYNIFGNAEKEYIKNNNQVTEREFTDNGTFSSKITYSIENKNKNKNKEDILIYSYDKYGILTSAANYKESQNAFDILFLEDDSVKKNGESIMIKDGISTIYSDNGSIIAAILYKGHRALALNCANGKKFTYKDSYIDEKNVSALCSDSK